MGVVCYVLPRISLFFPALVHDAAGSGRITERWQWQGLVLVRLEATHKPPVYFDRMFLLRHTVGSGERARKTSFTEN